MSKGSWQKSLSEAGPHIDLGYRILASILIFGGGGVWLDRTLDTTPWLSVAGAILSFVGIIGIIMRFEIEERQKKERREEGDRRKQRRAAGQASPADSPGSSSEHGDPSGERPATRQGRSYIQGDRREHTEFKSGASGGGSSR